MKDKFMMVILAIGVLTLPLHLPPCQQLWSLVRMLFTTASAFLLFFGVNLVGELLRNEHYSSYEKGSKIIGFVLVAFFFATSLWTYEPSRDFLQFSWEYLNNRPKCE
jgi:predicted tellurium resistance membrane protein TerC